MTTLLDRELDHPTTAADFIALEETYGAHNYHPLDIVLARGEGVFVWDVDGRKYMDFLAAYSSVNQGHLHPKLVAALIEQLGRVAIVSRAFRSNQLGPFCRDVAKLTGFARVLPMNSGAEAVETAVKAARRWAYRIKGVPKDLAEILVFSNNFHGRTTTAISFSPEPAYREDFGPLTPGFKIVPFGDLAEVEAGITPNTAAVLIEPVQGEGGILIPPSGYLRGLRELCTKNRVLFIADEIQSGLGRTGKLFACEHEGVRPDAMVLGKALSGGLYPVSAFVADDDVMDMFNPGSHGSTFGGNPVGAAVARVALRVLVEEGMVENSAHLGAYLLERVRAIPSPHVKEVRGLGLWVGIEVKKETGGARRFCEALAKEGLLCKETHGVVIRLAPPLVITKDELDWAIERIERVLMGA